MNPACRGTALIVRFNWPYYVTAAGAVLLALWAASTRQAGSVPHLVLLGASALAAFWVVASLGASWAVYDRSPLMTGRWIPEALRFTPRSWAVISAGFDEMTPALRRLLAPAAGRAFDIYDPAVMTEPSIVRARGAAGSVAERVDGRQLPLGDRSTHAIVLPLSAHELRTHAARRALFVEVARVLTRDGRAVVVEHLRDAANFLAFGPGFLHFHSRRAWLRCFADAGLHVRDEFPMTPFVRVFILSRPS